MNDPLHRTTTQYLGGLHEQTRGSMPQIKHLWAFVAIDPADENEGVIAFYSHYMNTWVPLISADEVRLEQMREIAQTMTNERPEQIIKLVKFTTREELETLIAQGVQPVEFDGPFTDETG